MKENNGRIDFFKLCTSRTPHEHAYASVCDVSENGASNVHVYLDIVGLIDAFVAGANEYICENRNKIQEHENSNFLSKIYGGITLDYADYL